MGTGDKSKLQEKTQKLHQKIKKTSKVKDLIDVQRELSSMTLDMNSFVVEEILKSPAFTTIQNDVIEEEHKQENDELKSKISEAWDQLSSMKGEFPRKLEEQKQVFQDLLGEQESKFAEQLESLKFEIKDLREKLSDQKANTMKENMELAKECKDTHKKVDDVVEENQNKFNQIQEQMEEIKGKFDHTEADEDESQYNDSPNSRYHEEFDGLKSQLNVIREDFSAWCGHLFRL